MTLTEIVGIITLISFTGINVYWTWEGRKLSNKDQIIKDLQTQLKIMDMRLTEMVARKKELKHQYEMQLHTNRKLEGELATYRKFNGHSI